MLLYFTVEYPNIGWDKRDKGSNRNNVLNWFSIDHFNWLGKWSNWCKVDAVELIPNWVMEYFFISQFYLDWQKSWRKDLGFWNRFWRTFELFNRFLSYHHLIQRRIREFHFQLKYNMREIKKNFVFIFSQFHYSALFFNHEKMCALCKFIFHSFRQSRSMLLIHLQKFHGFSLFEVKTKFKLLRRG